jgi:hypothetical protein
MMSSTGFWDSCYGETVTTIDLSKVRCEKAQELAARYDIPMTVICADLTEWQWPERAYDAVVSIFLHLSRAIRSGIHRKMVNALGDDGLIMIEAFDPDHYPLRQADPSVGGPADLDMLYTPDMLTTDFVPLKGIELTQMKTDLDEGQYHQGHSSVVRGIFRA